MWQSVPDDNPILFSGIKKCENPYSVQTYSILGRGGGAKNIFFTKWTQTNHLDFQNNKIHHVHIIHSEATNKTSK